ncbi:YodC family protein [Endozoicomonas sp. YOMI1]|uniref:YodC family protein n=1 Tax=Endozoicomonas sp. YOMI1 TaxID=2828739 RepID=UPI00214759AD|nr:YodC family protein [Endozoicomonas sp. YOMI1]
MEIRAKIGQLVRLRAGGPVLCVTYEYPMADGSYSYTCQWFEDETLRDYTFPIVALEPVEGEFEADIKGQHDTEVETEAEAETESEAETEAEIDTEEGDTDKSYH